MKPTRGLEPRTLSLRGRRGVCGWLRPVALSAQDTPISAVRPRIVLRLVQGVVLPPCCHLGPAHDLIAPGERVVSDTRDRCGARRWPGVRDQCRCGRPVPGSVGRRRVAGVSVAAVVVVVDRRWSRADRRPRGILEANGRVQSRAHRFSGAHQPSTTAAANKCTRHLNHRIAVGSLVGRRIRCSATSGSDHFEPDPLVGHAA